MNYKPADKGHISECKQFITFVAVPCPLPQAWQEELMAVQPGDIVGLTAVERRMRSAIGVDVTRRVFPPNLREKGDRVWAPQVGIGKVHRV